MTGILWGLLGALFVGVSDGIARQTTQTVSVLVLITIVMSLSTVVLTGYLAYNNGWPIWEPYAWAVSAVSGLLNLVALGFLYEALHRGPAAVAAPAASSFTILLVIINAIMGEPFRVIQLVAVAMVFIGVAMLAQPQSTPVQKDYSAAWLRTTMLLGLGAAIAISLRFYLAQEAGDILGPVPALYLNRASAAFFAIITLFALILIKGKPATPRGSMWYWVIIQATLESMALWAFLTGSSENDRIGATIGFAAFAAITTLTAWILFGERVPLKRWLWIGVIAIGIGVGAY